MHQPSGLLDRLSPTPLACPLVRLGHNSSSADETSTSNVSDQNYNYHCQYIDSHQSNNLGSRFHSKKIPVDNSYLQKQADTEFLQKYYQRQPYSDDHETAPLTQTNLYQKQNTRDLSSLSLSQSYWEHNDNKISNQEDPTYYRAVPKTHIQHHTSYLLDNFTLGKSSPTFDQGYHTLVSPSPGSLTTHIWAETNITKGKKYQNKNNSFDRLPDELTLKIFSFLSAGDLSVCARVCRKFDILVWTPSLWRSILIDGGNINGDKAIKGILRQLCGQGRTGTCPSIEKVRVADGRTLSDKSLLLIARRCPELVHLQLQSCTHITNTALFEIATRCHNLQHLDVSGCVKISCISINGPEPNRRLQLQYIDLTDCPALQDNGLRIIVCNCPQLAYLYLRRCIQITDSGLKYVPSFCSSLKELSVSDCVNMTDFGLYELAKLGAALRYLSVAKCDQVSDAGLKVIARKCYKLRYLNARGCEAVSDDAITVLARSCTRLRALDIGKCDVSDAGLRALAESCPNLKKLSLRNCDLVTDRGVQCIAYFCRGLQQLNIQDCQITLEGYRAVKMYCKRCVIEHTNPGFF